MPRQKDLKRLVRARMQKTGAAYTAARAQVVRIPRISTPSVVAIPSPRATAITQPAPKDYAALAGVSDAAIKQATGCTWQRWVVALDYHGAATMPHRDIAVLVKTKYKTPSWWTQTITVGYERIRGLRQRGQQRDGTYSISRSRTMSVDVTTLFEAWANASVRRRWLPVAGVKVRTSTSPRSLRLVMPDGRIVAVGFIAKGRGRSSVALEQAKLPDRATADQLKQVWSERLDALAGLLARA